VSASVCVSVPVPVPVSASASARCMYDMFILTFDQIMELVDQLHVEQPVEHHILVFLTGIPSQSRSRVCIGIGGAEYA